MKSFMLLISLWCVLPFCGCKLSRSLARSEKDTVYVTRIDSGRVSGSGFSNTADAQYTRETIYLDTSKGATIINNLPQPTVIIRETGRVQIEQKGFNFDSAWKARTDSLRVSEATKATDTNVRAFGWEQILLIIIAAVLVLQFAGRFITIKKPL